MHLIDKHVIVAIVHEAVHRNLRIFNELDKGGPLSPGIGRVGVMAISRSIPCGTFGNK